MDRLQHHAESCSDRLLPRLLGEAIQTIEALNGELDRTRAERDRLLLLVGRERKAVDASGVA